MLDVHLVSDDHMRRYSIALSRGEGWEVRFEEDSTLCWKEMYSDWHRVERIRTRFEREVSVLMERGWRLDSVSR